MNYDEVLAHLDALQMHKIKLGLDAMQSFLEKVGRPENRMKFVHLAGTNGKGSVCAALSETLGRGGYRVGVYTSPHLSCVRERFRVGCDYISEEAFARLGTKICEVLGEDQITYFEFTTALGLLWFAEEGVDLVLLETGMGGRLDATNVVTPLITVITSVSMDHEAYLGNSLAEIAGEKAGIIKEVVPVVSAAIHPEVSPVISNVSRDKMAPLYILGRDFDYSVNDDKTWSWKGGEGLGGKVVDDLHSNSPSLVQQENESLAVAVLQLLEKHGFNVTDKDIREGFAAVKWPGRMEYFIQPFPHAGLGKSQENRRYLLDGAHNPAGVKNLADTLGRGFSHARLIGVWGSMFDKDLTTTLDMMVPLFDHLVITQPDGERSASPGQIFELLGKDGQQKAQCIGSVEKSLEAAQEMATENDLIVVGGSLYLIGAIRHLLKGELV
ncbi:MAG: bifunctional folylpolyglutamate synthase/dihydrofolate synthase [Desulfobulbaceae bacterium]|nr:bifunctional folylpolyglutamate synthase/dihydrofolate synthase [Desulfobulbaceae bacterium]